MREDDQKQKAFLIHNHQLVWHFKVQVQSKAFSQILQQNFYVSGAASLWLLGPCLPPVKISLEFGNSSFDFKELNMCKCVNGRWISHELGKKEANVCRSQRNTSRKLWNRRLDTTPAYETQLKESILAAWSPTMPYNSKQYNAVQWLTLCNTVKKIVLEPYIL